MRPLSTMDYPHTLFDIAAETLAVHRLQRQYGHAFNLLAIRHTPDPEADHALILLLEEFQHFFSGESQLILAGLVPDRQAVSMAEHLDIDRYIVHIPLDPDESCSPLLAVSDLYLTMGEAPSAERMQQAMAAALPVLAQYSDITAARAKQQVLLFDPGEPAEMAVAAALLAHNPAFYRYLRGPMGANHTHEGWLVEGPFDTSYSLAIVNRELARGLSRQGIDVHLRSPESKTDKAQADAVLSAFPDLFSCYCKGLQNPLPRVLLRNNYPPSVNDMRADINILANYAWEESAFPDAYVEHFNRRLNLITVCSPLVKKILRDAGVTTPIVTVGNGVDHLESVPPETTSHALGDGFRFLHVSSCFPRKGLDVLLAAYGQAFRRDEAVTLVIKTFPNPHNDAADQIARHQAEDPDYPAVVLINEDLTDAEIAGIYQACDAFVLPSRAEGFGLPVAEAMLAGLPVIATGFGGHRYFCSEQTAWLVDYRFERAETHLGLFDSAWAEPSQRDLANQMKNVYGLSQAEIEQKTRLARDQLLGSLRWEQIAQRTVQAVTAIDQLAPLPAEPAIGWFSTWNSRCGIATYSEHLLNAIPARRTTILANSDAQPLGTDAEHVRRCWVAGSSELTGVQSAIRESGCEVMVIQFHYAFLPLTALAELIHWLKSCRIAIYLTLHNTTPQPGANFADITPALSICDRVLVHTTDDLNRLKALGLVNNVTLFPHGVYPSPEPTDSAAVRKSLSIGNRRIVASFGFLLPHKGIRELIEAFAHLLTEGHDLHLLLVNAVYPSPESETEKVLCLELIDQLGLNSRVTLVTDFLSDDETLGLLSSADCIVYPYQYTGESASGAVRMGIASRCPVLVTPLDIFGDVVDAVDVMPGIAPEQLAAGLRTFFSTSANTAARTELAERAERWRQAHQWPRLSLRLLGLIDGEHNERFLAQ